MFVKLLIAVAFIVSSCGASNNETWFRMSASEPGWSPRVTRSIIGSLNLGTNASKAVLVGGANALSAFSDVWGSDDGSTWQQLLPANNLSVFPARFASCLITAPDSLLLLGGYNRTNTGLGRYLADVWQSSDGALWKNVTSAAGWRGRGGHSCLYYSSSYWIFGGFAPAAVNDVWRSGDGVSWSRVGVDTP